MVHLCKKLTGMLWYLTTLFSLPLQAAEEEKTHWKEIPELKSLFAGANSQATFVLYDSERNRFYGYNSQRAATRYPPASTFKILNSLIAFDTGVVKSKTQIFPYDGKSKAMKNWEKEMDIGEAIAVSNVPVYQKIARKIGKKRMQHYITLVHYGNGKIGNQVDNFWLNGTLKISAIEQTRFLDGLLHRRWAFSANSYHLLQQIMPREKGAISNSVLFFKSGLSQRGKTQTGWITGWIKFDNKSYPFAMNVDIHDSIQQAQRLPLIRKALTVTLSVVTNKHDEHYHRSGNE